MVKITIDSIEMEIDGNMTVLQACDIAGKQIPRFCFHEKLTIAGNCRMCLVEIEGGPPKPVASCATTVRDGMVIRTNTEKIEKARKAVLEFLLINHPLDCPVCDQGGECDLQDQAFFYGCGKSRFTEEKRTYEKVDFGPLIEDCMNRCIHCKRCTRFLREVAGCYDLVSIGRGGHTEISTYIQKFISSEMSGNIIDLCPVGALTSKPYAFKCRPWNLSSTYSVDVLDAVGSSIRIDKSDLEIVRILPIENDEINESWISDRTRFAYDGFKTNRLDRPYIRKNGKLIEASWSEAFKQMSKLKLIDRSRIAAIAGRTADLESMFLLKIIMEHFRSPNIDCRESGVSLPNECRSQYLFNTTIKGIEEADLCLIINANPRIDSAVLNARIRKATLSGMKVFVIGAESIKYTYTVENLGEQPIILSEILDGEHKICEELKKASKPMLIIGQELLKRPDANALYFLISKIAIKYGFISNSWNGFNVLHNNANCVGGMDIGFLPKLGGMDTKNIINSARIGKIDFLYLLNFDDFDSEALHKNTFIVYQGHHGDKGAEIADVILPGFCYTEKIATYVNTEGKVQTTDIAMQSPENAREDWKILNDLLQHFMCSSFFYDLSSIRRMIFSTYPALGQDFSMNQLEEFCEFICDDGFVDNKTPFEYKAKSFYIVDPITRNSRNMNNCVRAFENN